MKRLKKILTSCLIATMIVSSLAVPVSAKEHTKTGSNSEFGTLTGYMSLNAYSNGSYRDKSGFFSTKTTKTAKRLEAELEVKLYSTGKRVGGDSSFNVNAKSTFGDYLSHNTEARKNAVSGYGRHEARGSGSLAVYTAVSNVK